MKHKKCNCCNTEHYTMDKLTHIGTNDFGPHYNCDCGSTLLLSDQLVEDLEEQGTEIDRQNEEEEQEFYNEHINWGRI